MKYGKKYLAMLQNRGKVRQVIEMAKNNTVRCSECGHGALSHRYPGYENMSTLQLTKAVGAAVPVGTRKYCNPPMYCVECDGKIAVQ